MVYQKRLDQKLGSNFTMNVKDDYERINESIHSAALVALVRYKGSEILIPYWWNE